MHSSCVRSANVYHISLTRFDERDYRELKAARGRTIQRMMENLKPVE